MDEINKVTSGMNWQAAVQFLGDNGIDSGTIVGLVKNLVMALVIFYVGRMVISLLVGGLHA